MAKKPTTQQLKVQWMKWYKRVAWFDPDDRETQISFGAYKAGFQSALKSERGSNKRRGK